MPRRTKADELRAREALRGDPGMVEVGRLVGRLADDEVGESASFLERSQAARRIAEALVSALLAEELDDDGKHEDPEG